MNNVVHQVLIISSVAIVQTVDLIVTRRLQHAGQRGIVVEKRGQSYPSLTRFEVARWPPSQPAA